MTVTIPATGGFELEVVTVNGNAQAGTLATATNVGVSTQFAFSTGETTSWTFNWTPPTTNVGSVVVYVTGGTSSSNYSNSLVLTPAAASDFSLAASPNSVSVVQGKTATSTMTVTAKNGFTGTVSYAASGLPTGVTASFSGNTLTLTASSTATVGGPTTVTITGTSGSLSHTTTVGVTVTAPAPAPDFSLSANPSSVSVAQGASGTSSMVVTPTGGFTGTVSYGVSGLPSGVTGSFSGNTLTLNASSTAAVGGPTAATVTGTSGSLSHTTTVGVTVTAAAPAPNFSLSANPSSVTVAPGSSASTTITITPTGGFNASTVSFTPPGLPTGLSATFGAISGGTSKLTISATSSASPMTIGVTITGTAGSLTHTAMVNLTVSGSSTQPSLTATPSSLSFRFSGGSVPAAQKIAIADPAGVVSFSASASGGSWLSVTPGSGSTPGSVTVSVNPSRLSAGTYTGAIQVSATGAAGISVPVTFTITSSTCIDDCGSGGGSGGSTGSMTAQPYANDPNFSGTVTSIWIERLGMPTGSPSHNPGLVLSKNTGAPSGTWAGATIQNASGSLTELGYDYRDGGQCTTTSPRFVVATTDSVTHVVGGCSKGTVTSAGMTGWKRVRFNLADTSQTSPAITPGEMVSSITLVLDLGPEAGSAAAGGLAVIDNIDVNGTFVAPGTVTRFYSDK